MNLRNHWDDIYSRHEPDELTWYQSHPDVSLRLVRSTGLPFDTRLLDVGGGTSILVDQLVEAGFTRLGVLDISPVALRTTRTRLGDAAENVEWIEADILDYRTSQRWMLWHDRAVFHFLVDPAARARYRDSLYQAVPDGGHIIISTFGPDGPLKCSNLETVRYSAEEIAKELGDGVHLIDSCTEVHTTPTGAVQQFIFARLRRVGKTV